MSNAIPLKLWLLFFIASTAHGQRIDLNGARCKQAINGEICFGGKRNISSFSGQGCFLTDECDVGVHGLLIPGSKLVKWTLSVIDDQDKVELLFWIGAPRRYSLRLFKEVSKFGVEYGACTADFVTRQCAPESSETRPFLFIQKPSTNGVSLSVNFSTRVEFTDFDFPINLEEPQDIGLLNRRSNSANDEFLLKSNSPQPLLNYYDAHPTTPRARPTRSTSTTTSTSTFTTTESPSSRVTKIPIVSTTEPRKQNSNTLTIILCILIPLIVIGLAIIAFYIGKRRTQSTTNAHNPLEDTHSAASITANIPSTASASPTSNVAKSGASDISMNTTPFAVVTPNQTSGVSQT